MTVSPDGSQVFLTANSGPNECAYVTIAFNAATGQQNWLATTPRQVFGFASAIAVSPDGSAVFVTGRTGTVAFDTSTGAQLWRDHYKLRWLRYPGYLAVSPDSATVFVTDASSQGSHGAHYVTTAYHAATGVQMWVARYDLGKLTGVTVSPDGSHVFVTGSGSRGFETIAYNTATGARLWAAPGLGNGTAVAIAASPDGSAVFVTGAILLSGSASEYATIAYSATTGAQLWAARYHGPAGASSSPAALGVSPDGSSVFVTGTSTLPSGHTEFATVAYGA
jgi:DNA-binding beta-propeller fold protein YncE